MPRLLGVEQLRSEDCVRRAFTNASEEQLTTWMDLHLNASFAPLLAEPWILDVDATVKPLYRPLRRSARGIQPGQAWTAIARLIKQCSSLRYGWY